MRTIMILHDTLRRDMLSCYNPDTDVKTPNMDALAADSIVFDKHFTGSMPCMPARRDIMCGRLNFLDRSWGPIEIFDETLPKTLSNKGIRSHMITDHAHYFRIGGENYCQQFSTYEFFRGQESDPWVSLIDDPKMPKDFFGEVKRQYECNRTKLKGEADYPSVKCFKAAMDWIDANQDSDDFFLMVETFDPHEPFDVPREYLDLYHDDYDGPHFDLPKYHKIDEETEEAMEHLKHRYKALITMTDKNLGLFIDKLKAAGMYEDTMIILTTDHGYCLGEREFIGKNYMPYYNELSNIPLIIHLPKHEHAGEHRNEITQNIDLMPTILEHHKVDIPERVIGKSLWPLINEKKPVKEYALYGCHGLSVNLFDGRYTYFRAPRRDDCCFEYTTSLTTIRNWLGKEIAEKIECGHFMKDVDLPVYKVPAVKNAIVSDNQYLKQDALYDIESDPKQLHSISDGTLIKAMEQKLSKAMSEHFAPDEQWMRLGLDK